MTGPQAGVAMTRLARTINSIQYFTVAFGCVVGVGWVIILGGLVAAAGPGSAALAIATGGLAILLVAFCYAEVASMRPAAGGELVYAFDLGGSGAAFATGWAMALITIGAAAFEAISIGAVVELLFPGATGPRLYSILGQDVRLGAVIIGAVAAVAMWWLNAVGAQMAARAQEWVTYLRIALMVGFLAVAMAYSHPANLQPLFGHGPGTTAPTAFLQVLITAPFIFAGFTVFATATEETSSGMRAVGRAVVLSIIAAGVFYVLLVLAISSMVPWRMLGRLQLPAAQAYEAAMGSPAIARVVLVTALLGNLTAWNSLLLAGSRVLFAMGRAGLALPAFGKLDPKHATPTNAIGLISLLSIAALFLGKGFILPVVNLAAVCYGVQYVVTCMTLIKLRRDLPDAPRPYRAPGGALMAWVAGILSIALISVALVQPWTATPGVIPPESMVLGLWALLGGVVWFAGAGRRKALTEQARGEVLRGAA